MSRSASLHVLESLVGAQVMARPRRALLPAALFLALAALAWVAIARPRFPDSVPGSAARAPSPAAAITGLLSRAGYGPGGSDVRVLWATQEYFRLTGQVASATHYGVEKNLVFFVWEDIHNADLQEPLRPLLRVDGTPYLPARVIVPAHASHHRFSVLLYPRADARGAPVIGEQARSLELMLPAANAEGAQSILRWTLPLEYPGLAGRVAFRFTWASLLALLGGLLASMWPCLFQLTAYFIPTLAGISVGQAGRQDNPLVVRIQVVKTAAFFVLGFAIVYTAAGAAAGLAAQSLSATSVFWTWRRPLSVAAGLVILFMALRLAINARAPLVCKMPVASFLGTKDTGHLGTMLLGLAFAIGCSTCFGAALILGIITYAGMAGTPLDGALIMFLFSLGMAVPLIAGAAAMARVLSLLGRLEKVAPWMALASSAIMAGFAVLLLTGRFMDVSNRFFSYFPK